MLNHNAYSGRLVDSPELQQTNNGIPFVRFCLAVERDYKVNGERPTDFIPCIAWHNTATFLAKHFRKGSMLIAQGRLESRSWNNEKGDPRSSLEVNISQVWFGESKRARSCCETRPKGPDMNSEEAVAEDLEDDPASDEADPDSKKITTYH